MSGLKTSTPDGAVVAYLADARARVDAVLQSWGVRAGEWWQAPVPAAMRYSLLSTGKRLRPTLVFAAADAVGGGVAAERVADLAAAVEVVMPTRSCTTIFPAWTTTICAVAGRPRTAPSTWRRRSWPAITWWPWARGCSTPGWRRWRSRPRRAGASRSSCFARPGPAA